MFQRSHPQERRQKGGSSPKKGTTQPCQRGINVDYEKSLGNGLSDGINIYIMMAHDIKIFFFYMKYLMINIDEDRKSTRLNSSHI